MPMTQAKKTQAYTKGVNQYYNYTANTAMLPLEVFYKKKTLANIPSFDAVGRRLRITIDTDIDSTIDLHVGNGTKIKFKQCRGRLYIIMTLLPWKITLLTARLPIIIL